MIESDVLIGLLTCETYYVHKIVVFKSSASIDAPIERIHLHHRKNSKSPRFSINDTDFSIAPMGHIDHIDVQLETSF